MPKTSRKLSKKDEYFVAIAKQGIHSFMILGVIKNGSPKLFARIGKTNDIDPDADKVFTITAKALGGGTLARIADEGISRRKGSIASISYQAYSINYEQAKEFIGLISDVEKRQLQNPEIRQGIVRRYKKQGDTNDDVLHREAIYSYVPTKENGDEIIFEWKKLQDCQFTTPTAKEDRNLIIQGTQQIQVSNTCRTSSLNIVQTILGFVTDVSEYFFVSLKYQTTLNAGRLNKNSFYVLPPPPTVNRENLTDKQFDILNKLYKRMEKIPILNSNSSETRAKFEAIKSTYKDIMGENRLSATALMQRVLEHEKNKSQALFYKREPYFLSKFFSLSSTTERMFKDIKKNLQQEVEREEPKKESALNNASSG